MSSAVRPERRRLRRIVKRIPAFFMCGPINGEGHVKNLTKEGVFVRTERLPEPGSTVQVLIKPEGYEKIEVAGTVRWTTAQLPEGTCAQPGFGLRIEPVPAPFREFFEALLLT